MPSSWFRPDVGYGSASFFTGGGGERLPYLGIRFCCYYNQHESYDKSDLVLGCELMMAQGYAGAGADHFYEAYVIAMDLSAKYYDGTFENGRDMKLGENSGSSLGPKILVL